MTCNNREARQYGLKIIAGNAICALQVDRAKKLLVLHIIEAQQSKPSNTLRSRGRRGSRGGRGRGGQRGRGGKGFKQERE